jgi:hypothetical protein
MGVIRKHGTAAIWLNTALRGKFRPSVTGYLSVQSADHGDVLADIIF